MVYHVFKDILIAWPTMQQVRRHLPKSFANFPQARVITDCTEIKLQKPTGPSAQKVTWSSNKSSKTPQSPTHASCFPGVGGGVGVYSDRCITMDMTQGKNLLMQIACLYEALFLLCLSWQKLILGIS